MQCLADEENRARPAVSASAGRARFLATIADTRPYPAALPLRGTSCQRWEEETAAVLGSAADWRWGSARDAVASHLHSEQPSHRLMTGTLPLPSQGESSPLGDSHLSAWYLVVSRTSYNRPASTGQGFLCKTGAGTIHAASPARPKGQAAENPPRGLRRRRTAIARQSGARPRFRASPCASEVAQEEAGARGSAPKVPTPLSRLVCWTLPLPCQASLPLGPCLFAALDRQRFHS